MSDYEIHDPRFEKLIIGHAKLERLWTGSRWAEGPVYVPAARQVLWSDIPNDRVLRFVEDDSSVSVFEAPCGCQNGHALDREGRVVACEDAMVSSYAASGAATDAAWISRVIVRSPPVSSATIWPREKTSAR